MRNLLLTCLAAAALGSPAASAAGALSAPCGVLDHALTSTADTPLDLPRAVTGTWYREDRGDTGKGVHNPAGSHEAFQGSSVSVRACVSM